MTKLTNIEKFFIRGLNFIERLTYQAEKLTYEGRLATKIENLSKGNLKTEINEIHLPPTRLLERHMYARVIYIESEKGKYVLVPDWIPKNKDQFVAMGTKGYEKVLFKHQTDLDGLAKKIIKALSE